MGFWARYSAVLLLWTGFLGIATRLEASSTLGALRALDLVGRKNAFVPAPPSGGGVGVIKSTVKILSSVFYEATIGSRLCCH